MEEKQLMEMDQTLEGNNDVVGVEVEEVETSNKGTAVLATVVGAAAIGVSYIAYKKVVKPGLLKLAKKVLEKMGTEDEDDEIIEGEFEEVDEDNVVDFNQEQTEK